MFLIVPSIPNPNLGHCFRIVEINGHQLRVKCIAATRISNCYLTYPLRSKNTYDLNCYAASYTDLTLKSPTSRVTMKSPRNGPTKPDVPTSKRMLLVLVLLLRNKPRIFLPLRLGVSVNLDELNSLQLGVEAFIYILPSRTNAPNAHGQNNSGARHRHEVLCLI